MDPLKFNNEYIRGVAHLLLNTNVADREVLYQEIIYYAVNCLTDKSDVTLSDLVYALQVYALYLLNVKKLSDLMIDKMLMESIGADSKCSDANIFHQKLRVLHRLYKYIVQNDKKDLLEIISSNLVLYIRKNNHLPRDKNITDMLIDAHTSLYRVELLRCHVDDALYQLDLCVEYARQSGVLWEGFVAEEVKVRLFALEFEPMTNDKDYLRADFKEIEDCFWLAYDSLKNKLQKTQQIDNKQYDMFLDLLFTLFLMRSKETLLFGKQRDNSFQCELTAHEYIGKQIQYLSAKGYIPISRIKRTCNEVALRILDCERFVREHGCLTLSFTYFPELRYRPFILVVPKYKVDDLFGYKFDTDYLPKKYQLALGRQTKKMTDSEEEVINSSRVPR